MNRGHVRGRANESIVIATSTPPYCGSANHQNCQKQKQQKSTKINKNQKYLSPFGLPSELVQVPSGEYVVL